MSFKRTVMVFRGGMWKPLKRGLRDVKNGEQFRLYEPNGKPVRFGHRQIFAATSRPYKGTTGEWTVDITNYA